ncbi:hypothetical protein [Pseudomonas sp. PLMAX]|uniref:hypothetical protein n=1 Tax=Pseudomonas sp. PLMAX TaxID=2201998 RepID=UPI0038B93AD8
MQDDDIKVVKNHASILIESLKPHGVVLKRSQALEVMSKLENRTDWNRLRVKLQNLAKPKKPSRPTETTTDAVCIVGGSRTDKTEILKTLFELESLECATAPILFSVSGSGHTFGSQSDDFFRKSERLTITYDRNGVIGAEELNYRSFFRESGSKGLLVNFVSLTKGSRLGVGFAIAQVLKDHQAMFPFYCRGKVGSLLIDDFHQIGEEELIEVTAAIRSFAKDQPFFIRLVATSTCGFATPLHSQLDMNLTHLMSPRTRIPTEVSVGTLSVLTDHEKQVERRTLSCTADSLADARIVADVAWWVRYLEYHGNVYMPARNNGESRVARVPGHSLWFRDLRASLIR